MVPETPGERGNFAKFMLAPLAPTTVPGPWQALLKYLNELRCKMMGTPGWIFQGDKFFWLLSASKG